MTMYTLNLAAELFIMSKRMKGQTRTATKSISLPDTTNIVPKAKPKTMTTVQNGPGCASNTSFANDDHRRIPMKYFGIAPASCFPQSLLRYTSLWQKGLGVWALDIAIGCFVACRGCYSPAQLRLMFELYHKREFHAFLRKWLCPALPVDFNLTKHWGQYLLLYGGDPSCKPGTWNGADAMLANLRGVLKSELIDKRPAEVWLCRLVDPFQTIPPHVWPLTGGGEEQIPKDLPIRCSAALAAELLTNGWAVRIFSKNCSPAAISAFMDTLEDQLERPLDPGRDRLIICPSMPALDQEGCRIFAPRFTPTGDRLVEALTIARRRGARIGLSFSPLIPTVSDSNESLSELFEYATKIDPEVITIETLNVRGSFRQFIEWVGSLSDQRKRESLCQWAEMSKNRKWHAAYVIEVANRVLHVVNRQFPMFRDRVKYWLDAESYNHVPSAWRKLSSQYPPIMPAPDGTVRGHERSDWKKRLRRCEIEWPNEGPLLAEDLYRQVADPKTMIGLAIKCGVPGKDIYRVIGQMIKNGGKYHGRDEKPGPKRRRKHDALVSRK